MSEDKDKIWINSIPDWRKKVCFNKQERFASKEQNNLLKLPVRRHSRTWKNWIQQNSYLRVNGLNGRPQPLGVSRWTIFLGGGPQQVTCNKNKNSIFGSKAQYMIQKQQRLLHCDDGNHRIMLPLSDGNLHFNPVQFLRKDKWNYNCDQMQYRF